MQREGVIVENLLHAVLHVPLLPRSNRRIGIVGIIYGRAMDSKMARDSISFYSFPREIFDFYLLPLSDTRAYDETNEGYFRGTFMEFLFCNFNQQ